MNAPPCVQQAGWGIVGQSNFERVSQLAGSDPTWKKSGRGVKAAGSTRHRADTHRFSWQMNLSPAPGDVKRKDAVNAPADEYPRQPAKDAQ